MGDIDVFSKLSHLLEKSDISKWENCGNATTHTNTTTSTNFSNTNTTAEFNDVFSSLQTHLSSIDKDEVKKNVSERGGGSKLKKGTIIIIIINITFTFIIIIIIITQRPSSYTLRGMEGEEQTGGHQEVRCL